MIDDAERAVDRRSLAASLAPALEEVTEEKLARIDWFRADWQRGGAATGVSTWRGEDGVQAPVVVKIPVSTRELLWLRRLQEDSAECDPVVPRVYASGSSLGGYDLSWVVMERFPAGPLGLEWHDDHIDRVAAAIARFHSRAIEHPVDQGPRIEPWNEMIASSLESVRLNEIAEPARWTHALKTLRSAIDPLVKEWRDRDVGQWLHGDVHLANAMSRDSIAEGPVALIDLAEVHAGNWIEDAVYLERQLWARPQRLTPTKPVRAVARARRKLGLPVEADWAHLAMIRRVCLAATAPHFIRSEGHPAHLAACLEWLERGLADLVSA